MAHVSVRARAQLVTHIKNRGSKRDAWIRQVCVWDAVCLHMSCCVLWPRSRGNKMVVKCQNVACYAEMASVSWDSRVWSTKGDAELSHTLGIKTWGEGLAALHTLGD